MNKNTNKSSIVRGLLIGAMVMCGTGCSNSKNSSGDTDTESASSWEKDTDTATDSTGDTASDTLIDSATGVDTSPETESVTTDSLTSTATDSHVETDSDSEIKEDTQTDTDSDSQSDTQPDIHSCIRYVDINKTGGDGLSWTSAFSDVQSAIDAASIAASEGSESFCEVWVARGIYLPSVDGLEDPRTATFLLKPFVHVYGGFNPDEDGSALSARVPHKYHTILSGDIQIAGDMNDNSYHVVTGVTASRLDGFYITHGFANGTGTGEASGAGMYNPKASPEIFNCTFMGNRAIQNGGGMYNSANSGPIIDGCAFSQNRATNGGGIYSINTKNNAGFAIRRTRFEGNTASSKGGGVYNGTGVGPAISDCEFHENIAEEYGGGMANETGDDQLNVVRCQFIKNSSTLDGGGMFNALSFPTLSALLFNGNASVEGSGGAMANVSASPIVRNCTITDNVARFFGGGVFNTQSEALFDGCHVADNQIGATAAEAETGAGGGGIANITQSAVTILNCEITGNSAVSSGGGIFNSDSSPAIINTVLTQNQAPAGAAIANSLSSPAIVNSTMVGNRSEVEGSCMHSANDSHARIANSIIWDNIATDGLSVFDFEGSATAISHSVLQDDIIENYQMPNFAGNRATAPVFVDAKNGDYHLFFDSHCCIDEGNSDLAEIADTAMTDADGNARIVGANVDIGADEAAFVFVDKSAQGLNDGSSWGNAFTSLSQALNNVSEGYHILIADGIYYPAAAANPRDATFQIPHKGAIYGGFHTVYPWEDTAPDTEPDTATDTAPDTATDTDSETVPDTAADTQTDALEPVVTRAQWNWQREYATILSGDLGAKGDLADNSYHVVSPEGNVLINGVIIEYGNANGDGPDGYGGAISSQTGTIALQRVKFLHNHAMYGGAISNVEDASLDVYSSWFESNWAEFHGGAIYTNATSANVNTCIFVENTAYAGGGMANYAGATAHVVHSTFHGNSSFFIGSGIYNDDASAKVENSILWGKDGDTQKQIFIGFEVQSSNVQGLCDSAEEQALCTYNNNIDVDPDFANRAPGQLDLHLKPFSNCVNAGNNNYVFADEDFDGNPRTIDGHGSVEGTIVDMGAYEFQGE
ncbi:MAG: hypothetical protein JXX14_17170 [Deltaproteobacteria bacterium]|nr:hypothetical protein [Deltaproteobacteria bacterium]